MKIMVVKDIEREDIEFICKVCTCRMLRQVNYKGWFVASNVNSYSLQTFSHFRPLMRIYMSYILKV